MPYVLKERQPPEPWPEFRKRVRHRLLLPLYMTNFVAEWAAYWLSQWVVLEVLEYAGSFSILIAVIAYFAESGERTQARHYQAWQVINSAHGSKGNGGRIDALESLNDDRVSLVGVDVPDASLEGLRLERAELRRAIFYGADLKGSRLAGSNFEDAELTSANLRAADLRGAVLSGAIFRGSDLTGAVLAEADVGQAILEDADLSGADLSGLVNWRQIAGIKGANIHGVRNAPEGFIAWAKSNGAVEQNESDTATTRPG
jgi:hypothetical protein